MPDTDQSRLRIALVGLTHPFRGGIAHYTTLLCRALRERHEVRFFALSRQYPKLLFPGTKQTDDSDDALTVEHEACLDSINPFTWFSTASRVRRFRPDLLLFSWWHPFFAPSFGTVAHLARRAGVPACFLCHNAKPHERSLVDAMLLRYVFSSSRLFVAHSRQDHDDLLEMRPGSTVRLNPHPTYEIFGADEAPSGDEAKRRLGLDGRRVLLFFGYVREYKGLRYLLDAMAELDAEQGYHLLIVGEFYEDRSTYAEQLDPLEQGGRLTLVDRYVANEEIGGYFAAADLVAVPYTSATQSGVVQMAYGFLKPVVATRVGGIPEVVEDGRTGYLVPPGDGGAIAAAVRRYFDEDRAEEFRRHIDAENEKYSWDRMVETIEAICPGSGDGNG
ncbi:MAG: glycosyltransferase [bacterium]|nr:glycosyltransferase [bacterium]